MNPNLKKRFEELKQHDWYQPIDFDNGNIITVTNQDDLKGLNRWDFLKKHLPDVKGKRILDVGCAEGLFTIQPVRDGASYAIGLDQCSKYIEEALFVRDYFSEKDNIDYSKTVEFKSVNILNEVLMDYGKFDLILCLRVLYHFNKAEVDRILGQLKFMTKTIAVQGCSIGKQYMCSASDIIETLFKHRFTEISLHNTKTSIGAMYQYFLVIGKQE